MSAREGGSVARKVEKPGKEVSAAGWREVWGGQRIEGRQRDLEGRHDSEDWAVSVRGTAILSLQARRWQRLKKFKEIWNRYEEQARDNTLSLLLSSCVQTKDQSILLRNVRELKQRFIVLGLFFKTK